MEDYQYVHNLWKDRLSLKLQTWIEIICNEYKARHVWDNNQDSYILSGDTIVDFNIQIIGKPSSHNEAFEILNKLSNKTHSVISGLTLFYEGTGTTIFDKTNVTFKKLSQSIIKDYINSFDVLDKAGAYNIEDAENILIKHIDGCYNNIVGFPLKKFKMSKIKKIIDTLWFSIHDISVLD